MRELVLDLAVTGRLVTQNRLDEPASVLLHTARTERERLTATRKIKARKSVPIGQDEQPFGLPSNWEWARLSEVGYELGQKAPDRRFTYIDVGGIDAEQGCISDRVETLEPHEAPSRARKRVVRGTVIYSTVRPYLRNIAIIDRDIDPEPIASTAFGILYPFAGINVRYLFYWLRSAPFTTYVQDSMKGMAYPAINDEKFYSGFIALPPLAEQQRIVAKVDELMALCDRLEAQQQEREARHGGLARAALGRFAGEGTGGSLEYLFHSAYAIAPVDLRRSILTAAFQGDLAIDVGLERGEHAVTRVINEASKARREYWVHRYETRGNYPLPVAVDTAKLPRIPKRWQWASLDSLCAQITDGEHIQPPYQANGVPMLSAKHVRDGYVTLDNAGLISEEAFLKSIKRCRPTNGDILIVSVGATTGRSAIVADCPPFAIVRSVLLLKPVIPSEYLLWWLKSPWAFTWMTQASGASAQPHLYIRDLKRMPVPIPSFAEQLRIVARINKLVVLVDQLEAQLIASRTTATNLLNALVAELTARN